MAVEIPERAWSAAAEDVAEALDTTLEEGLSTGEAEERGKRFGPNRLHVKERPGPWEILWNQLESLIVVLLAVAALASLAFGQHAEAVAIGVVLVVNTAIGFWMEFRAVRSMASLQEMGEAGARVVRDGSVSEVRARELVPGDVVRLREGDVVTADLRLARVDGLRVDESALTGESVPVDKQTEPVADETPLADRVCMAYRGTVIRRGEGTGVVVCTGMETELGEISALVEEGEDESPLDQRLDRLGRKLVWLTLAVAGAVAGSGIVVGRDLLMMVQTGIALAVAAIPEGLAIVATVALARGMHRMMERNALVRRLSAVETLGSATVICADKTGTLTRNRMTVRTLVSPAGEVTLSGDGDGGNGSKDAADGVDPAREESPLHPLFVAAVLATEADPDPDERDDPVGDPMDLALLRMGRDLGLPEEELHERLPHRRTVSFDTDVQMMATVQEEDGGFRAAVKGAPEAVLEASAHIITGDGSTGEMDGGTRDDWLDRSEELAGQGLRVLAVADRQMEDPEADPFQDVRFLGLVAFHDPPREDVADAIRRCQGAGIRVIMATGDHRETARQIAGSVGLARADGAEVRVAEGGDLPEEVRDGEADSLADVDVFARVDPEQKLRLIDFHQARGEILAMTGDGVNDAPALRSADIGVAMGERGTDVAREASDMVLLDDAFATIVAAVEMGRTIFRNTRKFVIYLLSGNVGEILAVGAATVAGLPLPLLPLQILYLNLVNDVFPALALGIGPGDPAVMERPPRDPSEGILERRHWWMILGWGAMIAAVVLGVFVLALRGFGMETEAAVTVSFLGLSTGRLLHAFNMRDRDSHLLRNEITRNRALWGALALCLALLALAVLFGPLAAILKLVTPGGTELLLAGGAAAAILVLGQGWLLLARMLRPGKDEDTHTERD